MAKIVIFGAGRTGSALLRILEKGKNEITIIEENKEICDEIAAESNAVVVHGDATDPQVLDELRLKDADYVFAVTGNEETNFLASIYSKQEGAGKVISKVSEAKHSFLLERLDIETVIAEYILAKELANRVTSPIIYKMLNPLESDVEMFEKTVDAKMDGKKVGSINKEHKYEIISIFDEGKFTVAKPAKILKEGMKIVIIRKRK
jgi:trk system potassium uptake protein TrkA